MKKLLIALILTASLSSMARAVTNKREFEVYRTTIIAGAWTNALVATGTVFIATIQTSSAAAGSSFQFFGSTWANGKVSTGPVYDTSSSLNSYAPLQPLTSGFMFTTVGNSTVTVQWDWIMTIPRGQENIGRY